MALAISFANAVTRSGRPTTRPEPRPLWSGAQGQRSPQCDLVLRAVLDGDHAVLESHVFDLAEICWRTGVEHQKAAVDRRLRRQRAEGGRAEHSVLRDGLAPRLIVGMRAKFQ